MLKSIDINGNLELVSKASSITVEAKGSEVICHVHGDLIQTFPEIFKKNHLNLFSYAKILDKEFKQLGLDCKVMVKDRLLLAIGSGAKRTLIPSLFGSKSEFSLNSFFYVLRLYFKTIFKRIIH